MALVYSECQDDADWVTVRGRRLQCFGGQPNDSSEAEPLPRFLSQLSDGLVAAGIFPAERGPNHVLLNGELSRPTCSLGQASSVR
jgi:hypothetical protein